MNSKTVVEIYVQQRLHVMRRHFSPLHPRAVLFQVCFTRLPHIRVWFSVLYLELQLLGKVRKLFLSNEY